MDFLRINQILFESKNFHCLMRFPSRLRRCKNGKRRSHGFKEWGKMYFVNEDGEIVMNENPDVQKILASNNLILLIKCSLN